MQYGVFLDFEGASKRVGQRVVFNALRRVEIPGILCNWIVSMLGDRKVITQIGEKIVEKYVNACCPQGGVLSPVIWDCIMDEILEMLKSEAGRVNLTILIFD